MRARYQERYAGGRAADRLATLRHEMAGAVHHVIFGIVCVVMLFIVQPITSRRRMRIYDGKDGEWLSLGPAAYSFRVGPMSVHEVTIGRDMREGRVACLASVLREGPSGTRHCSHLAIQRLMRDCLVAPSRFAFRSRAATTRAGKSTFTWRGSVFSLCALDQSLRSLTFSPSSNLFSNSRAF